MISLATLGWNPERAAEFAALEREDLVPARVAAAHRGRLDLLAADGPIAASVAGRLRHEATSPADLPAVGDWVAVDPAGGIVHAVLPRRGGIARAAADGKSEAQVLAANVDIALVLGSLNRDLNIRRLERMLTLAADARADAVVVLSKADLDPDPPARVADVRLALGATVPVLALSVHAGTGLEALTALAAAGRDHGPARLLGRRQDDAAERARRRPAAAHGADPRERRPRSPRHVAPRARAARVGRARDRHPGAPAPARVGPGRGLETAFADVATLARRCRFTDCRHAGEPGCAVAAAVEDGRLPADRYAGLVKLERERASIEARRDARARARPAARPACQRALRGGSPRRRPGRLVRDS